MMTWGETVHVSLLRGRKMEQMCVRQKFISIMVTAFLETVKGGESVKAIGEQAFAKCPKLKTFKLSSKQLISIGANCFKGDKKLKSIVINKTKMLTKAGLKKSLAGSKIKTVKVAKKKVKAYKKIFTKKVCGKKVTVTK